MPRTSLPLLFSDFLLQPLLENTSAQLAELVGLLITFHALDHC